MLSHQLHQLLLPFLVALLLLHIDKNKNNAAVSAYQYKVGDLDAWGIPPSGNSHLYSAWSQKHNFHIGDALSFLYPPSQDSVIQVTEQAFNSCSISDPILKMGDGNSVFNLTTPGKFYFTSGMAGHCLKSQKLEISVPSASGSFFPSADAPVSGSLSASSPSYPTVFGPTSLGSAAPPRLLSSSAGAYLAVGSGFFLALIISIYP